MRPQASVPLRELIGKGVDHLRGASTAAKKVTPRGYGWVPTPRRFQSRPEKIAIYRKRHEDGAIVGAAWDAVCANYPELKGVR